MGFVFQVEIMEVAFIFCFAVVLITCCSKTCCQHQQRPNIVFILADDLVCNVILSCSTNGILL